MAPGNDNPGTVYCCLRLVQVLPRAFVAFKSSCGGKSLQDSRFKLVPFGLTM
jgi:hypothetical protein